MRFPASPHERGGWKFVNREGELRSFRLIELLLFGSSSTIQDVMSKPGSLGHEGEGSYCGGITHLEDVGEGLDGGGGGGRLSLEEGCVPLLIGLWRGLWLKSAVDNLYSRIVARGQKRVPPAQKKP